MVKSGEESKLGLSGFWNWGGVDLDWNGFGFGFGGGHFVRWFIGEDSRDWVEKSLPAVVVVVRLRRRVAKERMRRQVEEEER